MMEMQLCSATSVILVTCTFIFLLLFSSRKRHSAKLPPSPWKLPIIGHIHHLIGAGHPHRALHKLSLRYGPLVHLKLGHVDHIVVSSAEAAKDITKHYDLNFASRPNRKAVGIITYGYKDIAFAPYGSYWRQVRKQCFVELLAPRRVKTFDTMRDEEIAALVSSVKATSGAVPLNLTEMVVGFTNAVTSRAAFGSKCRHGERFIRELNKVIEQVSGFSLADLFSDFPILDALTGMSDKVKKAGGEVDVIIDEIIKEHEAKRRFSSDNQMEHDIVDVLLDLKERTDLDFPFGNDNVKAVIFDLFSAGSDSSSIVIVWAMTELMRSPEAMAKAQAEVRGVLKGKDRIEAQDINELHYLKFVVKETLRLHASFPLLLPRICTKSCQIGDYDISEGTTIVINAWAIGRDPKYWEDAESFRPERFEGSYIDYKGNNYELLPFGSGRRMCPGINFATANMEVLLANLLYNFDWELPHGLKIEDLDMSESFGISVSRKQSLWLIARCHDV